MLLAAQPYLPDTQLNPPPHAFPTSKFHRPPTVISASPSSSPPKVQTTELSPYYSETDLVGGEAPVSLNGERETNGEDRIGEGEEEGAQDGCGKCVVVGVSLDVLEALQGEPMARLMMVTPQGLLPSVGLR